MVRCNYNYECLKDLSFTISVLETWPVRNSAASVANHTHFRAVPRTFREANISTAAQRLILSKFSPNTSKYRQRLNMPPW
jgi:hypothetical protein